MHFGWEEIELLDVLRTREREADDHCNGGVEAPDLLDRELESRAVDPIQGGARDDGQVAAAAVAGRRTRKVEIRLP